MTVHWRVSLACSDCNAAITYEDERPNWIDDHAVIRLLEHAREWVALHPTLTVDQVWTRAGLPPLVNGDMLTCKSYVEHVETMYVECPACDGRAYRGSDLEDVDLGG